jgi:hypothetical protein
MLIHGTKYDAAQVAPVVRHVHCEKCGCDFSYEMIRRGTGAASTAYGLFAKTRAKAAVAEAAKSLQQQLEQDQDPVGCPDCGWIQSAMVADLRRRAHRWMMKPAWAISIFLLLFDGLWIAIGISARLNGAHVRPIGPIVAVIVGAVAITIVSATAAMQYLLRSWIDPNRGYPDQPGYIPGAPQAIKLSDSSPPTPSGGFNRDPKLPYERKRRELEPGGWITVQLLAHFRCPPLCCKCLSSTSETHTVRITKLARVSVPHCRDCRRRALRSRVLFYAVVMLFSAVMGFFVPAFCGAKFDAGFSTFIAIIFGVLALITGALLSFRYPGPVRFSRFRHDLNTVRLRFRNPAYARLIIEQGQLT